MKNPDRSTERAILLATTGAEDAVSEQVFDATALRGAQQLLRRMPVGDAVVDAILNLVRACRPDEPAASKEVREAVAWGAGSACSASIDVDSSGARTS